MLHIVLPASRRCRLCAHRRGTTHARESSGCQLAPRASAPAVQLRDCVGATARLAPRVRWGEGQLTEAQAADLGTPAEALRALSKLVAVLGTLPAQGAPLASAAAHVACTAEK
jgi:hypothetical protein